MGVQKQEMTVETSRKKLLSKPKPEDTEYDYFDADIVDISFGEDLWTAAESKQETNTSKLISDEENYFKSIWDITVAVSEESSPPSEAHISAENSTSDS